MPIYLYRCGTCEQQHEYLVARPGDKPEACNDCSGQDLTRVYAGQTFGAHTSGKDKGLESITCQIHGESKLIPLALVKVKLTKVNNPKNN